VGDTSILEAGYHGRWLGRADLTVDPATKSISLEQYQLLTVNDEWPANPDVADRVAYWADMLGPDMDQPVGTTSISLRRDYNGESNMGNLVTDGMLRKADEYDDGMVNGSVDIAFTNPGGLRTDIIIPDGTTEPYTITWQNTFEVMPFGNTLFLMDLTGAQVQTLLDQSAALHKGILQTAGATWSWSNDCQCDTPATWSAFDIRVGGGPLDNAAIYRVVTNDFLAAGQVLGVAGEDPHEFFAGIRSLGEDGVDEAAVDDLVAQRVEARKSRDWARADEIRDQLAAMNIVLEDRPEGTVWRIKRP